MTLSEFFHMGGYAFYVWTAYGITLVVLLINILLPMQQHHKQLNRIARRVRRQRRNL
ncbi:MAG TPA: heme exporter protein CcmD [Acidiferrobacteraceae bacterium]|nr:heme exporter protein CcmD [Acidiferrobacteraceae bacterium]